MSERDFRDKTAIAGIGYSRSPAHPGAFSKNSGVDVLTLATRAARAACADAGLDPKEIDGAVMYQMFDDSVRTGLLLSALGCRQVGYASNLVGGGNYSSFAVFQAAQAVYHGICNYVLVYRALNGRSGVRMGHWGAGAGGGSSRVGGESQFSSIYGLAGAASHHGFEARRYMDLYGVTSLDLAHFAVNSRSNAVKNPRAMMRTPITVEDHQNSRMICDPYHLLDCCQETDVACALIVTSAERARALRKRPVLISAGIGGGVSPTPNIEDTNLINIGPRLLRAADVELKDIDIFEAYDAFTDMPMRMIEDMGWCRRGEARDFIKDGRISLDGELPTQTHGGLINEGYCHGFNNVLEAVQQLRGDAEDLCPNWQNGEHTYDRALCRQVRGAEVALNASVLGSSAIILKKG
jgi:acetyl-CoA acetyltransferase